MTFNELASSFDTVGQNYEKFRPNYVPELYREIFASCSLNSTSQVLEIGIGTGQATLPFLATGCQLIAIEPGINLADVCKEKFSNYPNLHLISGKFEDVSLPKESFDLIYSATAFHWIPEVLGYTKVFSLLKKNGIFSQFSNHPDPYIENPELGSELNRLYDKYFYFFWKNKKNKFSGFTEENAKVKAETAKKYGFQDCRYFLFRRIRTFSAKEYVGLLGTYSDHIALKEPIRSEFFSNIEEAINNHGGAIKIRDTFELQLSTKKTLAPERR